MADPGFESHSFDAWSQCGTRDAAVSRFRSHSGLYSVRSGGSVKGDSGVCQRVTIPPNGRLSFWTFEFSNEADTWYAWQEADLLDSSGHTLKQLYRSADNTGHWVQKRYDVSAFSGQTLLIYFGVHNDGHHGSYAVQYVDDVSLTAGPQAAHAIEPSTAPSISPSTAPTPVASTGPVSSSCGTCGVQRWHVKTLSDSEASAVNFTPQSLTVTQLNALLPPGSPSVPLPDDQRFGPTELQTYVVRANFVGWKLESDSDFHLVIADPNDSSQTMIVEVPSTDCSGACSSNYAGQFKQTHDAVVSCLGQPPSSLSPPSQATMVEVTGVGFFDAKHGQTGVGPKGLELHPVLSISWLSGPCH